MVAGGKHCASGSTITATTACTASLYRRIKRRVGSSFKQAHCQRNLVPSGKQAAYKLFGTKSSLFSHESVQRPLQRQDNSCSNRQHHSGVIHKQGRSHEVVPTLCPTVENLDLLFQETSDSKSPTHSRPAECGSRQAIHARPDHPDRVVSPSRVFLTICSRWHRPKIDLFATRFNNKLPVCVFVSPVPDPLASAVDAHSLPWEDLDAYAFPPGDILCKVVEKLQDYPCKRTILIALGWPNMPWFWDLVAMSSQNPLSLPNLQNLLTALQSDPTQESDRASLRQWQQELRLLKGDQPYHCEETSKLEWQF